MALSLDVTILFQGHTDVVASPSAGEKVSNSDARYFAPKNFTSMYSGTKDSIKEILFITKSALWWYLLNID